jgi:hypothetical protein
VLTVTRAIVHGVGGAADRFAARTRERGRLLRTGRVVQELFGTETLRHTSFAVGIQGVARSPVPLPLGVAQSH